MHMRPILASTALLAGLAISAQPSAGNSVATRAPLAPQPVPGGPDETEEPIGPGFELLDAHLPAPEPPELAPAMPAILPEPAAPAVAAPAFRLYAASAEEARRSAECLTAAIYHEARSESQSGQRAVAQVVLNRVRHPAFPASICGVVYQGSMRRTGCQFSFTCDGSLSKRIDPAAWARARQVAETALQGSVYPDIGFATHYHTTAVRPWWAPSLTRVRTVGSHIFYRWSGQLGAKSAFRQAYAATEPESAGRTSAAPAQSRPRLLTPVYTGAARAVKVQRLTPAPGQKRPKLQKAGIELVNGVRVYRPAR